jgi:hypothetical protein
VAGLGARRACRIIREEGPPRPGARLATPGEALPAVSARRGAGPKKPSAPVRGGLDRIVTRALEKGRARRYEAAGACAADARRSLGEGPVGARPPSGWYRSRKPTAARVARARLTSNSVCENYVLALLAG